MDAVNLIGLLWSNVNCDGMAMCEVLSMGEVCGNCSGDEAAWMESWSSWVRALVNMSGDAFWEASRHCPICVSSVGWLRGLSGIDGVGDEEAGDVEIVLGMTSCSVLACEGRLVARMGDPGDNDKRGDVDGVKGLASGLRMCVLLFNWRFVQGAGVFFGEVRRDDSCGDRSLISSFIGDSDGDVSRLCS